MNPFKKKDKGDVLDVVVKKSSVRDSWKGSNAADAIKYKSENQPVTNADIEINEFLKKYFKELTPQYGWLS